MIALSLGFAQVSLGPTYDPALDVRCVKELKKTQKHWFSSRACLYDTREAHADFIAAELALSVRARHSPGPCMVMTLGLPAPGPEVSRSDMDVLVHDRSSKSSPDASMDAKMAFWVNSMQGAGAFDCATKTFVDPKAVPTLTSTLESLGHHDATVETLWNDRKVGKQLDEEFDKMVRRDPKAKFTVLINDAKRSRSQFARFKRGLESGKVSTIIWRREIASKAQRKALLGEVKLVARYGYSVYLAGASVDVLGKTSPTAYLRVDHGAWDDIFSTPNTGIELTIVAVSRDNKLKALLDQTMSLCPVKSSVLNFNEPRGHSCHCDADKFVSELADSKCSLSERSRLGASTYNWLSSFLGGRTDEDAAGVEELDAALGEDFDEE